MKWNDDKTITITPPAKPKKMCSLLICISSMNAIYALIMRLILMISS